MWYAATVLLLCGICSMGSAVQNVKIDGSIVVGYQYSDDIRAYTGIPYAKAPVGNLRFEPPRAFEAGDIINDKAKENVMCAQVSILNGRPEILGEEDCLYLNIYVPNARSHDISKYPVMVYIHGGAFAWGTGVIFKPDFLLREKNVILVTINYRVGPLGFLAAGWGTHKVYANNGMKDQAAAIKWIHDNIVHFGGDNAKITLFGNSAGGASTNLHLFSPKTKGLFHGAITQSGGAFCDFAVKSFPEIMKLSTEFSRLADCPVLPSEDMISCLKTKSKNELLNTVTRLLVLEIDPLVLFTPTVEPTHDDAFLLDYPINLLQNGHFYDVPVMQGTVTDEGAIHSSSFAKNSESLEKFDKYFIDLYQAVMFRYYYSPEQIIAIRKHYFGDGKLDQNNFKSLTSLLSDEYFRCVDDTATFHHQYGTSPVYSYRFDYKGTLTFSKVFANDETIDLGVCHMDELLYLFPLEFFFASFSNANKSFTEHDSKMSNIMVKLWTHFTHHRNFDNFTDQHDIALKWNPVRSTNNEYLLIDQNFKFEMHANLYKKIDSFWNELLGKGNIPNRDEL